MILLTKVTQHKHHNLTQKLENVINKLNKHNRSDDCNTNMNNAIRIIIEISSNN